MNGTQTFAPEGTDPPDRIFLRDHVVEAEIGAFQEERDRRQRLRFEIWVELRERSAADDDVDRVVSYDALTEAVRVELAHERLNLLETLAERIAARVLAEPRAARCGLRIEKLDLGPGALGVEMVRSRAATAVDRLRPQRPVVVFLSDAAVASPKLTRWIDGLAAHAAVLCVGPAPAPRVPDPSVQRRIDLLAIEQTGWILAARDRRCVVTSTRTELDWAMQRGRLSVWAPSKMVLDATDAPVTTEATALAAWLAGALHAGRLVFLDAEPPDGVGAERLTLDAGAI